MAWTAPTLVPGGDLHKARNQRLSAGGVLNPQPSRGMIERPPQRGLSMPSNV
jgi:hypothetical protein